MIDPRHEGAPLGRSPTDRADGFASRNRDTTEVDQIFKATGGPGDFIEALLRDHASLDVLEVGFGWGVALLRLCWRFRDRPVRFHGVDIEPKPALATRDGMAAFAVEQGIVPAEQASLLKPPSLHFYDASRLAFADESLDFIYSAVTVRFMKDKIGFIEACARVLRPGGQALLHLGESNWNYPRGPASDPRVLTPFTARLILKHGDELIPLPAYFRLHEGDVFSFRFTEESRCILVMSKHRSGRLDLGLVLDPALTMPAREVPLVNRKGEVRGGARSVYEVDAAKVRALGGSGA